MPPLKLKFDKQQVLGMGLNRHNDFKLVTHCSRDEAGQQAILREQLAYELYGIIAGSAAFRTQLFKVTYVDSRDGSTETAYAILIEDKDELEDRLAAEEVDNTFGHQYSEFANADEVVLFQYLIGNTDFSLTTGRNVKLLADEQGRITAVPYDFDFCGLVDANYVRLHAHLEQTSSRDRRLIWEFPQALDTDRAADWFLHLKAELIEHIENYDLLDQRSRREIKQYVQQFYRELSHNRIAR